MKTLIKRARMLAGFSALIFLLGPRTTLYAQSITVTSANPNTAPQGAVNLNVLVSGNGFKKGAIAKWFVSGTNDTGGVTVNSTAFVSSSQLSANITVATNAVPTSYDIVVYLTNGSSGKGTKLFSVTVPDPTIAYITSISTVPVLNVMNADGTNQLTILQAAKGACIERPDWSPDHSQLVFEMLPGNCGAGQPDGIYVINKDGSGLRQVVTLNNGAGLSYPVWSPQPAPDGYYKIAFSDQVPVAGVGQNCLFLVNLDGTGLINLTTAPGPNWFWPTWDPSATRLAAQVYPCASCGNPHLYVYDLASVAGVVEITNSVDLTAAGGTMEGLAVFSPEWARTQDEIVFTGRFLSNQNNSAIWIVSLANPANPVELTPTYDVSANDPSWSPDDSKIVFRQVVNKKVGIYTINADGSGVTSLAASGDHPRWRRCCPTCSIACAP